MNFIRRALNALRALIDARYRAEQEVRRSFNPDVLRKNPQMFEELVRIKQAESQAKAVLPAVIDAITNPQDTDAERRFGSALKRTGAQASTGAEKEGASALRRLLNALQAPQRGVVAWIVQLAGPGSKYASGTEAFADDAEWGALLENYFPHWNVWLRRGLAIPMNLALDPLNFLPPAKAADLLTDAAYRVAPTAASIATNLTAAAKYSLARALHPTAYKVADVVAPQNRIRVTVPRIPLKHAMDILRTNFKLARANPNLRKGMLEHSLAILGHAWPFRDIRKAKLYAEALAKEQHAQYSYIRRELEQAPHAIQRTIDDITDEIAEGLRDPHDVDLLKAFIDRYWGSLSNEAIQQVLPPSIQEGIVKRMMKESEKTQSGYYRQTHPSPDAIRAVEGLRILLDQRRPRTTMEKLKETLANTTLGKRIGEGADIITQLLAGEPLREIHRGRQWIDREPLRSETVELLDRYSPIPLQPIYRVIPELYSGLMNDFWRWLLAARLLRTISSRMDSDSSQ